jgi:hypothetical protein
MLAGPAAGIAGSGRLANPIPNTLARAVPSEGPFPTLGLPGGRRNGDGYRRHQWIEC